MPSLVSQILRLERQCFAKGIRWERESLTHALDKYKFIFQYDKEGKLIALIATKQNSDSAYIQTIDVDKAYRGKGIASLLVYEAEFAARKAGAKVMKLHVAVDNPAQTLYFKLGYRAVNFHRNFYDDAKHTAAIEMHKPLIKS